MHSACKQEGCATLLPCDRQATGDIVIVMPGMVQGMPGASRAATCAYVLDSMPACHVTLHVLIWVVCLPCECLPGTTLQSCDGPLDHLGCQTWFCFTTEHARHMRSVADAPESFGHGPWPAALVASAYPGSWAQSRRKGTAEHPFVEEVHCAGAIKAEGWGPSCRHCIVKSHQLNSDCENCT